MRVLVVSDTHRDRWALQKAILAQPKAEVVVHLGDGEQEALEAKRSFRKTILHGARKLRLGKWAPRTHDG